MNSELKKAAKEIGKLMKKQQVDEIINTPLRFYGIVCDNLFQPEYSEAKKLFKKGIDSGIYIDLLSKSKDRENVAQKSVLKLKDSEFMDEGHAREIVGLLLIALYSTKEQVIAIERWIDECASKNQLVQSPTPQPVADKAKNDPKQLLNLEIEALIKRTFMFLEEKNWTSASQYAERVLDKDPECSRAYLAKLMADLKVSKEIMLGEASTPPISNNNNFKYACKYASEEELRVLKDYEYRNAYARGKSKMQIATEENHYLDAAACFALCKSYKDSNQLYDHCMKTADAKHQAILAEIRRKEEEARRVKAEADKKARQIEERGQWFTIIGFLLIVAATLIDVIITFNMKALDCDL